MGRTILFVTVVLLLAVLGYGYWFYYNPYSDGSRVGMLQKFSRKGNVFKTYEGELLQEGFNSTRNGGITAQYFYFSVVDEKIAAQLEKEQGQIVKVHYTQYRRSLPWRGESTSSKNGENGQYIVDRIEELPRTVQPMQQPSGYPVTNPY